MGNLVADAMRDKYPGVDAALTNSGGLRADLLMSPGRFPQVSGLRVEVHCDATTPVVDAIALAPDGPDGTLTPLSAADTVRIVTNDFMFTGGDGYAALAAGTDVLQPGDA